MKPCKLTIDTSDPETKATWEAALAAKREVAAWPAWKRGEARPIEIRRDPDGTIDEIIADGSIHLEMMDRGYAWIGITTRDGKTRHVNIYAQIPPRRKRPVLTVQTREG